MKTPRIYLSPPHMGTDEFEFVRESFATNWIAPVGPHVDAFEQEFAVATGARHAVALSSGTAALHLALRMLGVERGDEVFCSDLTFAASANPIVYEGGTPVFIDSEPGSWNMDPALLDEALKDRAAKGKRPKAVILVHLYGQTADLDAIVALCERHGVPLIEDAAEALGARFFEGGRDELVDGGQWTGDEARRPESGNLRSETGGLRPETGNLKPETGDRRLETEDLKPRAERRDIMPGTRGVMGIYSFNGNKIITTSGGGMLVSNDRAWTDRARFLSTQARDPAPHYEHSQIGFNYRMSNVLAGIGRGQLRVLQSRVEARRTNFEIYAAAFSDLPGITMMPEAPYGRATRWLTCALIDAAAFGCDRETLREALAAENIEARPVWKPMHLQPVFAACDCFGGAVGADLFARGICLPSGSSLTRDEIHRVIAVVRKVSAQFGKTSPEPVAAAAVRAGVGAPENRVPC